MSTDTPQIAYVVGAGPYPYRADGRRMNATEAASYLKQTYAMSALEAHQLIDMVTTQAVRDAGVPAVERVSRTVGDEFRVAGADPQPRREATRCLITEWRLTPAEAADTLDHAPVGWR